MGGDSGLVTVSRFPIIESEFTAFKYGVFSDSYAMKGVLYSLVKIQGEYLMVFNTHLNASYFGTDFKALAASIQTRQMQLEHLRDFINLKLDYHLHFTGKVPLVILLGDMNVDSRDSLPL